MLIRLCARTLTHAGANVLVLPFLCDNGCIGCKRRVCLFPFTQPCSHGILRHKLPADRHRPKQNFSSGIVAKQNPTDSLTVGKVSSAAGTERKNRTMTMSHVISSHGPQHKLFNLFALECRGRKMLTRGRTCMKWNCEMVSYISCHYLVPNPTYLTSTSKISGIISYL